MQIDRSTHKIPLKMLRQIMLICSISGAVGGLGRASWETVNSTVRLDNTITDPLLYLFLGAIAAVVCIFSSGLIYAPRSRIMVTSLLCGLFFFDVLNAGQAQFELMQERERVHQTIENVAEVTIESNSPAASRLAIDQLENLALEESVPKNKAAAIEGVTKINEATESVAVKVKGIETLVNIALESDELKTKQDIYDSLLVIDYNYSQEVYQAAEKGLQYIQASIDEMQASTPNE